MDVTRTSVVETQFSGPIPLFSHTRRVFSVALIFVLGVLAGCRHPGPSSKKTPIPGERDRVSVEMIPPKQIIEGEPVQYKFRIRNHTDHPVVLLELQRDPGRIRTNGNPESEMSSPQGDAKHNWVHTVPGILTYDATEDRFTFQSLNRPSPGSSEHRVFSGLLSPGKKTTVQLEVIHNTSGTFEQTFRLRYYSPDARSLRNKLYVPDTTDDLRTAQTADFVPYHSVKPAPDLRSFNYVCFHPSLQDTKERTVNKSLRVHRRPFSKTEARKKLNQHIEKKRDVKGMTYSPWLDAWIIGLIPPENPKREEVWSVSKYNLERLTGIPFNHLQNLNAGSGAITVFVEPKFSRTDTLNKILRETTETNPPTMEPGSSHTFSRKKLMQIIKGLIKHGLQFEWIRRPLTDEPAVNIISSP